MLIVADNDGVIVITLDEIDPVVERASAIAEWEQRPFRSGRKARAEKSPIWPAQAPATGARSTGLGKKVATASTFIESA